MYDPDDEQSIVWMSARTQRVAATEALAIAIAEDVVRGATVVSAAAKYGISRSKLMRWLDWGMEADAQGAGPEDIHAPYLDFFLKVLQAQGIASVNAQQTAAQYHTQWWLQNHPETRAEFGGDNSGQLLLAAPAPTVSEAQVVEAPQYSDTEIAEILRTLIDAGLAVLPADEAPGDSVESDTASIPPEDEEGRQAQ